jgi:beta-glucosidase
LGFRGFLVSDWQAVDQLHPDFATAVATSINAGLDMVMVPYDYRRFIDTLTAVVARGDVAMSRIDDAVGRILSVKYAMGLFDPTGDAPDLATVGAAEHRALAREAARRSFVLLADDGALPLGGGTILVSGEAADNIGLQCGGWTIKWQGEITRDLTPGTTLLDGLRRAAPDGARIHYDAAGEFAPDVIADTAVVFLHETPYAEGLGDREDLRLPAEQVALLERARARGGRVVAVLVSGRPLIITEHLPLADAWVMAWLPGTEGEALGDVLFGHHPFTGRLPLAWPRTMADIPGGATLFARGHGTN